ncbi:helix-turn-helix transcriptional regulator [Nocardia inohanensis]|uniref:helix-turn-helix transcriptional regulator n=1 Tax=Nocardia inohanensis TaxID=209246 RepID=UPI000829C39A|nr:AAA family ATPase [Nocardia inohanensis]
MFYGRASEIAALDDLLLRATTGRAGVAVLRGEAGIGKSALLEQLATGATGVENGFRVLRATGTEAESNFPFAGLHLLFGKARRRFDLLPDAQAAALRTALDSGAGVGNPFLVGAATLTLLADLAEARPLLCLIDDAQWVDRASLDALLFAARRLDAEPIVLIFAVRDDHLPELQQLAAREFALTGLPEPDAEALLTTHHPDLTPAIAHWIVRESHGNPLALQVLPTLQHSGGAGEFPHSPAPTRIQRAFTDQISRLPVAVRNLLLIAATDSSGDAATIRAAATLLAADPPPVATPSQGGDPSPAAPAVNDGDPSPAAPANYGGPSLAAPAANYGAALPADQPNAGIPTATDDLRRTRSEVATPTDGPGSGTGTGTGTGNGTGTGSSTGTPASLRSTSTAELAAEAAGLLRLEGDRILFRHPLIRAAAYQGASAAARRAAHRALAGALVAAFDDRRAWHLAAAATGPDEEAARALEHAARCALGRGGLRETAAAYERAARLSPGAADKGRRLAAAARAAADAGDMDRAEVLAETAIGLLPEPGQLAQVVSLRAAIARDQDRPRVAYRTLTSAAAFAAEADPETAGRLLFQAAESAWSAGDLAAARQTARQAERSGLPGAGRVRALVDLLDALNLEAGSQDRGKVAVRELLADIGAGDLRERAQVVHWQLLLGDMAAARDLAVALEDECRNHGALGILVSALWLRARIDILLGHFAHAEAAAREGIRLAADTGQRAFHTRQAATLAHLAALRGAETACRELASEPLAHGVAPANVHAEAALGLLDLGLGRPEAAFDRYVTMLAGANRHGATASLPDLIEAAHRIGRTAEAEPALRLYTAWAEQVRHPWALAIADRCRALTTPDAAARHFEAALELHHTTTEYAFERARTELLYGEWLRREQRRADARRHLRAAMETFERLDARPWAERARNELRATGETRTAAPATDVLTKLTPQELQSVQLAAEGLSNRDIAARLFLSPRTVGYHLSNAYPKLGITSRRELASFRDLAATR